MMCRLFFYQHKQVIHNIIIDSIYTGDEILNEQNIASIYQMSKRPVISDQWVPFLLIVNL